MIKVITYGSFDLFHEGHYNLLKRAKALGDFLIVGVTSEKYDEYRGKLNIYDSLVERIDNVRKTGLADQIIIEDHVGQKVENIIDMNIDVFVVGSDWINVFDYLNDFCKVVYLERTKDISSSILRGQRHPILKMGIIGAGRIASRFVPEAKYVSGINVEAVYTPNIDSARAFAERFDIGVYEDNFSQFLNRVNAVYIASPHNTHYGHIMRALEEKKHVLCEKPMVLRKCEAETAFTLAEQNGCVLMEAIKTAYCPGFSSLLGVARSGSIGSIYDVEACFTKLSPLNSRELTADDGGSLTELGSYPLMAIFKIFGTDFQNVRFESFYNERGLDIYTKAFINYSNCIATAKVGLGVKSEGQLIVSGKNGYLLASAPWWKTTSFELRYEDPENNEMFFHKYAGDGLRYVISNFVKMVNDNSDVPTKVTKEESIALAYLMETFLNYRETKLQESICIRI